MRLRVSRCSGVILRSEEAWVETTGCKGLGEPFQSVRTDWLRTVVSRIPTDEVESFALLWSNLEIGRSLGGNHRVQRPWRTVSECPHGLAPHRCKPHTN